MQLYISEYATNSSIIEITGRVDIVNSGRLRQKFDTLFQSGVREFVIDLSDIDILDSKGLTTLISMLKRTRFAGGDVQLVLPKAEGVRRVLQMTRFDRLFKVIDGPPTVNIPLLIA